MLGASRRGGLRAHSGEVQAPPSAVSRHTREGRGGSATYGRAAMILLKTDLGHG